MMDTIRTLRVIWGLLSLAVLLLVLGSIAFNGGAVSELTIGLLLLAHAVIFYVSLPSSLLVQWLFGVSPVVDLIGSSKYQDVYLLVCMAIVGYLQWWLVIEPALRRLRKPRAA